MATESDLVCLVIHRNMRLRFRVKELKDSPLCSSTVFLSLFVTDVVTPVRMEWRSPFLPLSAGTWLRLFSALKELYTF
jgi:hypothetical protein